jgi:hypothetical protein
MRGFGERRRRSKSATHGEMMRIIQEWKTSGGRWPAAVSEITSFALKRGLYNLEARVRMMCSRDLAKAMREEYIRDSQGRPVRKLHSAPIEEKDDEGEVVQRWLWHDIDVAPREFMEIAFKGRRMQIVGECRQLFNDVEYFNNRKRKTEPIQLCFDFRDDISEANMPDEYVGVMGSEM